LDKYVDWVLTRFYGMNKKHKIFIVIILLVLSVGLGFWSGINNFDSAPMRIVGKFAPTVVVFTLFALAIHRKLKRR